MADWKTIPDTDVDPDAPVTSELMYALRDNPVAIAEGAVGAPRISPYSLLTGFIGNASIQGQNIASFIDMKPVSSVVIIGGFYGVTGAYIQVSLSSNNGSSWGAWGDMCTADSVDNILINSVINTITGSINSFSYRAGGSRVESLSVGVPSGKVNAIRFRGSSSNSSFYSKFQVFVDGGQS